MSEMMTRNAWPADDMPDLPGWMEARLERAAILEFDAGMTREEADKEAARLHPEPGLIEENTCHR